MGHPGEEPGATRDAAVFDPVSRGCDYLKCWSFISEKAFKAEKYQ